MTPYHPGPVLLALSFSFCCCVWAGEKATAVSRAPACQQGDCRPLAGAARVQGALLQAAALSVVSAVPGSPTGRRPLKALPRRSRSRLPSWYTRTQMAQWRHTAPLPTVAHRSVRPGTEARVRESSAAAMPEPDDRSRPAAGHRLPAAATRHLASFSSARSGGARPEARGARHRRLVQASRLTEQEALDEQMSAMTLSESAPSFVEEVGAPCAGRCRHAVVIELNGRSGEPGRDSSGAQSAALEG